MIFRSYQYILGILFVLGTLLSFNCSETSEIVNNAVNDFVQFCPYTDLCSVTSNVSIPDYVEGFKNPIPCCRDCLCHEDCGTECCPDKPDNYVTDQHIQDINKEQTLCVPTQFKTYYKVGMIYNRAYELISVCPPNATDVTVARKCRREYQDFDLDDDLQYLVPVSIREQTFKNKFCAECNNADVENSIHWTIGVHCTSRIVYHSFQELITVTQSNYECDIVFFPGQSRAKPQRCSPLVDRCNITGDWDQYDVDVERACLSYTSVYKRYYKNVHCYICNIRSRDQPDAICQPPIFPVDLNSFVTLLDFKGLLKTTSKTAECLASHIYDPFQEICRYLICPDYMYSDNGTCKTLRLNKNRPSNGQYTVTISAKRRISKQPSTDIFESLEDLYVELWDHIVSHLNRSSSNFTTCNLAGFIILGDKEADFLDESTIEDQLIYSDVDYFALKIIISGRVVGLLSSEMDILESLFKNTSESNILSAYSIRYKNIPLTMYDRAYIAMTNLTNGDVPFVVHNAGNSSFRNIFINASEARFYDHENAVNIVPLPIMSDVPKVPSCPHISLFQVHELCPKLLLSSSEFTLTEDGIVVNRFNLFLPNHELIFTFNDSVLVCYNSISVWMNKWHVDKVESNVSALDILSIICLGLSLICLGATLAIYISIKQLQSLPGLNIIALAICLFSSYLITLIDEVVKLKSRVLCIILGILLHSSFLMAMLWMFVCTFHMARVFIRLERVNPRDTDKYRIFFRYFLFTLIVSILIVGTNITVSLIGSEGSSLGYGKTRCYIDSTEMILYTAVIPLACVVVSNVAMFLCVMIKLSKMPSMKDCSKSDRNYITIFAKLSTITGITYSFIFLYQFTEVDFFAYIFVLLNAGQGVFIFFAFVCNKRILNILKNSEALSKLITTETKDRVSDHSHQSICDDTHQTRL